MADRFDGVHKCGSFRELKELSFGVCAVTVKNSLHASSATRSDSWFSGL
jgi:hypothetical protein